MKVVILAGGRGTRISEESHLRPKPMINIGERPILWHIMKGYASHGFTDFIICLGYKGYMIKEYFANYRLHASDCNIDLVSGRIDFGISSAEPWSVSLVDTGSETMTGGRVRRIRHLLSEDEPFFLTYGDGLADVDIRAQLAFHRDSGLLATMTVVRPPARFGSATVVGSRIATFKEKSPAEEGFINGGFFVLETAVIDNIDGDSSVWEREPLERLLQQKQVGAWHHDGFWQPMDTLREKEYLEQIWAAGRAPWKSW